MVLQEERLTAILQHLNRHEKVTVDSICDLFGVSRDTARRDLIKLEEQGYVIRTRGGAVLQTFTKQLVHYEQRLRSSSDSKTAIGKAAAARIRNGDYLFLDSSTTVQHAAANFQTTNHVIVTNSIDIAGLLIKDESNKVHTLGGLLHPQYRYVYGPRAISQLSEYTVDKLLLGTGGISTHGIYSLTEEYGFLIKEMLLRAEQTILLADHTKFGKRTFHKVAGLHQIDMLITDKQPDEALMEALNRNEVEVVVVE